MTTSFRSKIGGTVRFNLPKDATCPCGKPLPPSRCCLRSSGFYKKPCDVVPRRPKSGLSNSRCYAAQLADCSNKISKEHYVSRALLEFLNERGGLFVGGMPWTGEGSMSLPPSALTSKVLCTRHNSALAELDAQAVRFFDALHTRPRDANYLFLFNGHDLEKWLLKMLCGLVASRSLQLDGGIQPEIDKSWPVRLFRRAPLSDEHGVYICKQPGQIHESTSGLVIRPIGKRDKLTGLGIQFSGTEIVLSMSGFPERRFDGREFAYRPSELYTDGDTYESSTVFCWNDRADLGTIKYTASDAR